MSDDNNKTTQNNKPKVILRVVPTDNDLEHPIYGELDISDTVTQYYNNVCAFDLYTNLLKTINVSADGFEDFLYLISPVKIKTAHRQLDELIDMVIVNGTQNNAMKRRIKEIIDHTIC